MLTRFLILLALAAFCIALTVAIRRNVLTGDAFRYELLKRMRGLGLFRILKDMGIEPTVYVHGAPIHRVERQMRNCEAFTEAQACDRALDQGNVDGAGDYCPKHAELTTSRSAP